MPSISATRFYRVGRALRLAVLAAPVLVLLGVWWLVTQVLMAPPVPDAATTGDEVARFVIHAKGLPRLGPQRRDAFLETQIRRLAQDAAFRERFLAEYRTASPEDQRSFRAHIFDALKPMVFRDIDAYERQASADRDAFLDDRIVYYNRVARLWGNATISKHMLGSGALSPTETLEFVLQRTTERERERAVAYAGALAARIEVVLVDPVLKEALERRITAP